MYVYVCAYIYTYIYINLYVYTHECIHVIDFPSQWANTDFHMSGIYIYKYIHQLTFL
jgi:hypothetical protein